MGVGDAGSLGIYRIHYSAIIACFEPQTDWESIRGVVDTLEVGSDY